MKTKTRKHFVKKILPLKCYENKTNQIKGENQELSKYITKMKISSFSQFFRCISRVYSFHDKKQSFRLSRTRFTIFQQNDSTMSGIVHLPACAYQGVRYASISKKLLCTN